MKSNNNFIKKYRLAFLFIILSSFFYSNSSFCQKASLIICNDFESETTNLTIESGIWEIGEPDKTVFNGSYNSANSIVTDLLNPYNENETSVFYLIFKDDEYGGLPNYLDIYLPFELSFDHRFLTNSEDDFGSIEMSLDNGSTWYDVLSDDYNVNGDFYLNEHYFESTGETLYDSLDVFGNSDGWVHSNISKDIDGIVWDNDFFRPDSLILRFSFTSGAGAGNDGWQIDNICMKMDIVDDVSEGSIEDKIMTYPNPATKFIVFKLLQNTINTSIQIFDVFGRLVEELRPVSGKIQWNLENTSSGVYFYQTEINGEDYRGKLIIE